MFPRLAAETPAPPRAAVSRDRHSRPPAGRQDDARRACVSRPCRAWTARIRSRRTCCGVKRATRSPRAERGGLVAGRGAGRTRGVRGPARHDRRRPAPQRPFHSCSGRRSPAWCGGVSETLTGRAAMVDLAPLAACEARAADPACDLARISGLKGGFFPTRCATITGRGGTAYLRSVLEARPSAIRPEDRPGVHAAPASPCSPMAAGRDRQRVAIRFGAGGQLPDGPSGNLDVLERDLSCCGRLPPYFRNVGKRLVKAPKLYLARYRAAALPAEHPQP